MKPLQIGLLVAAGALGGAMVMKWQSSRAASDPQVTVTATAVPAPAPASTPAQSVAPAEAVPEPPAAAPHPSPFPEKNKAARPKPAPKSQPGATVIAQNDGPSRPPVTSKEPPPEPVPPSTSGTPAGPTSAAPPARPAPPAVQEPAREPAAPPAPAAPATPNRVTLAANTLIPIRLVDGLTTERSLQGDTFTGTLDAPLAAEGFVIAERGARVEGKVVDSVKAGKVSGVSSLSIALTRIRLSDGQNIAVQTQTFTKKGETSHGEDAAKVGGGAAVGAIIGAIAGGGKGAGIGAGVGGAAGAGDVVLTRGKAATLVSETRINFRLAAPVTVTEQGR